MDVDEAGEANDLWEPDPPAGGRQNNNDNNENNNNDDEDDNDNNDGNDGNNNNNDNNIIENPPIVEEAANMNADGSYDGGVAVPAGEGGNAGASSSSADIVRKISTRFYVRDRVLEMEWLTLCVSIQCISMYFSWFLFF